MQRPSHPVGKTSSSTPSDHSADLNAELSQVLVRRRSLRAEALRQPGVLAHAGRHDPLLLMKPLLLR